MADNPAEIQFYEDSSSEGEEPYGIHKTEQYNTENYNNDVSSEEENDGVGGVEGDELNDIDYENESQDTDYVLPEICCAYCHNDDVTALAQCVTCKKWFCNSQCRYGSHIVQHCLYSDHKSIRLHPNGYQEGYGDSPLCCFNNPQHTNVFTLGTIQNDEGYLSIICRDQCLDKSRLKEIGWNADTWTHIIKDRHFVDFLLNCSPACSHYVISVTNEDIRSIEAIWKTKPNAQLSDIKTEENEDEDDIAEVPSSFSSATAYNEVFLPLIDLERASDKTECESRRIENVTLRWENGINNSKIAVFHNDSYDSRYRVTPGQIISFHLPITVFNNQEEVVYSGKVIHSEDTEVRIQMMDKDLPLGKTSGYYITFSWIPTTFDRMASAVRGLFDRDCMSPSLYNLILGHPQQPRIFPSIGLKSFSIPFLAELNSSQLLAVQAALQKELTLIQGPPGTGKTITSATIIYHLVKDYSQKVLVCAPSNVAVDNLALRISRLGINVVRLVSRSRETVSSMVEDICLHNIAVYVGGDKGELYELNSEYQKTGQLPPDKMNRYQKLMATAERVILRHAEVVCCTCAAARDPRLMDLTFKNVLIDESTQACEPECLIPIVNGCERLIMVGDHQQLGPVILNQKAQRAGFGVSMFERLLSLNILPYRLNVQYRMHPALSEFSSNTFYNGELQNGVHSAERTRRINFPWPRADKPMMFWAVAGTEDPGSTGRSLQNRIEANCVQMAVKRLLDCNITPDRIGVITPYDSQRSLLVHMLCRTAPSQDTAKIEVASVDEFQGREKDYIIFSCVRSNNSGNLGFLTDTRRLNVALTRAKYGIIIIGNPTTLKNNDLWLSLLKYYQDQKCLVCGSSLDNLSSYIITFDSKKFIHSRRQFNLGKKLRENENAMDRPDSSIFLGLGTTVYNEKQDDLIEGDHSSGNVKIDIPLDCIIEDTGVYIVCLYWFGNRRVLINTLHVHTNLHQQNKLIAFIGYNNQFMDCII